MSEHKANKMPSQPLLFHTTHASPTTRDIAQLVKAGGTDALSNAARLADAARYQQVTCRSALNHVARMPFKWTLNPYRGCTHGCHYCFARRYHVQFEMNASDDFASVILVKTNFVEVLKRELGRPRWKHEHVALGTATDPYQPIEGQYRLTRGTIEALTHAHTSCGLITKGPMIVRDRDVLSALHRDTPSVVYMSVPTVDEDAWRALEPGTASPQQRLRAVRELADAGINVGVLMAPIVPGFTSARSKVERTIKAIADHGARFVGCNVMYLQDGTRSHFMSFLHREFPAMAPRIDRLYQHKAPPDAYQKEVKAMVRALQERYGLTRRRMTDAAANSPQQDEDDGNKPAVDSDAEQVGFSW